MRNSFVTVAIILCTSILLGCALDRMKATSDSNVSSEFAHKLNNKILKSKIANKDEVDSLQISKLEGYKLGSISVEQFMADGWDAKSPFFGLLGVVGAKHIGGNIEITIGSYRPGQVPTTSMTVLHSDGSSVNVVGRHTENINITQLEKLADSYQNDFDKLVHQPDGTAYSIWPSPRGAQLLGNLSFENGVLKSILLNGSTLPLGTSDEDLHKLSTYFALLGHASGCDIDVTEFTKKVTRWEIKHFPPGSVDEKKYVDPLISTLPKQAAEQREGRTKYTCEYLRQEITKIKVPE